MNIVDLNTIKEQYQRMSDNELLSFTKNESLSLTLEAFHLLKSEFRVRSLDFSIIENAEIDRDQAQKIKLSEFEQITTTAFTETIWKFAFDEKETGKKDSEIYDALLKKNIAPEYASMLIENMEPTSRELAKSFVNEINIGWIMFIIGILLSIFLIGAVPKNSLIIVWGPLLTIGGMVRLATSYSKRKKFQTIVKNIELEKEAQNLLYQ